MRKLFLLLCVLVIAGVANAQGCNTDCGCEYVLFWRCTPDPAVCGPGGRWCDVVVRTEFCGDYDQHGCNLIAFNSNGVHVAKKEENHAQVLLARIRALRADRRG